MKIFHFIKKLIPNFLIIWYHTLIAILAAFIYKYPSRHFKVIGVTGTDGKTTTVMLINHILETAGFNTGMINTIFFKIASKTWQNNSRMTTPGRFSLQKLLAQMKKADIDYAVIETTSHALAQNRVKNIDYDIVVLTNVTHEHLDYHKTFENYRATKGKLFKFLSKTYKKPAVPKVSILNIDDSSFEYFNQFPADIKLTYGIQKKADIMADKINSMPLSSNFSLVTPKGEISINLKMPGLYNVYNFLAAATCAYSQNIPLEKIKEAAESFKGVPGRMEIIQEAPFSVIVDYAHTPDSFKKIFELFRGKIKGKIWAVFGSAGQRDIQKRAIQGEISGKMADFVVITDEDPRFENRLKIINEIAAGVEKAGKILEQNYWKIPDRDKAIEFAIKNAQEGDLVLILGKGHEQSIIYGDKKIPWDDRKIARKILNL